MFDWFTNKNKRLQNKIDKYIDLEKKREVLKSEIDECADNFSNRKQTKDSIMKSESDKEIKKSVSERYDNFVNSHIVEIGDLKRRRDKIESDMNNLIKGDEDFLNLVKKEREVRKFKSILSKYRSNDIDLSVCDTLIKAIYKKRVDYADNLVFNEKGLLLLLKRSELDESKPGYYTIPGGHVDSGEDFETAAKRELLEEAGIKSDNVSEVGKYENEDVCIHYFRSDVVNVEPVLQEEEIWSYEWVDPKEIDKYKLPFNMGENITKILFPIKHQIITINKSFDSGVISESQRDLLLENVLEKAKSKYELKLEKQAIRKKDPDFFVEKYHEWNNQSEVPSYSKPSIGSVLEFFQNNYEDFSNDDELKEMVLKRLNKSEESDLEKSKSGIYKPTNENKKLGRVGQKYGNIKEVNKYQKIKDYAEQVIRGEKHIKRLSPEEEQGRIRGGRANVEATLLIGRYAISDKSEVDEISKTLDIQEKELEDYAKENNLWIDYKDVENWERLGGGEEASVYPSKSGYVKKVYDYKLFSFSPLEFLDNRISLHNFLFPDTAYELVGFTKSKDRGFQFAVEQPYIDHSENTPVKNIKEEMEKLGFKDMDGNSYYNDNYIIDDLHHKNVLTNKDGKLYFIDTVPYLNEEGEGYDGKRKYNTIKLEKSEEDDFNEIEFTELNKALESNLIDEPTYNSLLEKAWKKQPIGTVTTRKDGRKYRKVSETGNTDQDWKLVSKDKTEVAKDEAKRNSETKQVETKPSKKELQESAKNTSETALNNAIKQSPDPEVRQTAHEELQRRESEEKPKEEDKKDTQKSEEIDLEKAKDQIKGGLADKLSIEQIAEKHGVSVKSIKKQIKLGKKVEMEHTDDPKKAKEIARDHISEFKDYYTRLTKMEDETKKENKDNEK